MCYRWGSWGVFKGERKIMEKWGLKSAFLGHFILNRAYSPLWGAGKGGQVRNCRGLGGEQVRLVFILKHNIRASAGRLYA